MKRMMDSPTIMNFCQQPRVLPPPTNTGMWAGINPELIDTVEWPAAPALSLAIDRVVRDALSTGLSLRETYQQVRAAMIAEGVQPDGMDLDRCVKDHVFAAI